MKKVLLSMAVVAFLASCGSAAPAKKDDANADAKDSTKVETTTDKVDGNQDEPAANAESNDSTEVQADSTEVASNDSTEVQADSTETAE